MSSTHSGASTEDDRINMLHLLIILGRRKGLIALAVLLGTVLAALVSLLITSTYTGLTRTLIPQQSQSLASAMLNQLGGLAGLAGGNAAFKNPGDIYIDMLKSNTIADVMLDRFHLLDRYHVKLKSDARASLHRNSRFSADRSGIMTVEVDDWDPKTAADMANAYVEELYKLTSTLAVTEAAQRRLFFERQLQETKDRLAELESKARQSLDRGGLASLDAQGLATVETIAKLRASISLKEVQIGSMNVYAGANNPEMLRAQQELASIRQELARLEGGSQGGTSTSIEQKGSKPSTSGAENLRLLGEVKYNQTLFEFLAKQYEIARLDESKEAPVIQVMDRAEVPDRRSSPRRLQMTIVGFVVGLLAGVLACFAEQAILGARSNPSSRALLDSLRTAWLRRSS